jgi:hypothetical protein
MLVMADVDKGAEVMYNMMKNLEAGGEVSEESQGLEGARENVSNITKTRGSIIMAVQQVTKYTCTIRTRFRSRFSKTGRTAQSGVPVVSTGTSRNLTTTRRIS